MALLQIIGTMVFLAVVALSLMAVVDILRPRRARVASAERAPDYARALLRRLLKCLAFADIEGSDCCSRPSR